MGSDIVKPVKKLVRSIEKRTGGIMIGVGTGQPVFVTAPNVPVNVSTTDVSIDAQRACRQLRAAAKRPPPRPPIAQPPMPPTFPIYRWSLDSVHHVISFDNVNAPATGWYLNPATPIGQVYKEAAYGRMIAFNRWTSSTDVNLYYYCAMATMSTRKRAAIGAVVLHASNVLFGARGGRRVNVDPSSDRLGSICVL